MDGLWREVTPENLLRVLTNRHPPGTPRSKKMLTDSGSNLLFFLTGHGGDEFIKFQDQFELMSKDVADALGQMREKRRYNEVGSVLFVVVRGRSGGLNLNANIEHGLIPPPGLPPSHHRLL